MIGIDIHDRKDRLPPTGPVIYYRDLLSTGGLPMNGFCLTQTTRTHRRLCAAVAVLASAAVLLASFEDEALLAIAGEVMEGHDLEPCSGRPDPRDGFPDLCRQVETQVQDHRLTDAATATERVVRPPMPSAVSDGRLSPPRRASGSPLCALLCVWLI